jgi:hypothetical protein
MNTVGKILVILNFLFAVIVGAFLVIDFATRSNWQTEYTKLKGEFLVVRADRDQTIADSVANVNKIKEQELLVQDWPRKLEDQQKLASAEKISLENRLADKEREIENKDTQLRKNVSDLEALKVAESDLKTIVKNREQTIIVLQDDVNKFRTKAIASEQSANAFRDRNEQLLKEVQDLGQKLAVALAGPGSGGLPTVKNANEPNPPSTFVKGKIEKVDASGLVQISLGTDQGVHKNNTLEVFRTQPEPKYLGMVRIVDANFNSSVGRLIVPAGTTVRPQLREGDNAWSKLGNN